MDWRWETSSNLLSFCSGVSEGSQTAAEWIGASLFLLRRLLRLQPNGLAIWESCFNLFALLALHQSPQVRLRLQPNGLALGILF